MAKIKLSDYLNYLFKKDTNNEQELLKNVNMFILNRFISFKDNSLDKNLILLCNYINKYTFTKVFYQNKDLLLQILYYNITKNNNYINIKYIKNTSEKITINKEILKIIKNHFKCEYLSNNELYNYLKILLKSEKNQEKIIKLLIQAGITLNEIKKELNNLINNDILNKYKNIKLTKTEFKKIKKELL